MQKNSVTRWWSCGLLGAVLACALIAEPLEAQVTCPCTDSRAFGSCIVKRANYPDEYPGAVALATIEGEPRLYVADLFNGLTYGFDAKTFQSQVSNPPIIFTSPRGSNATTGMAVVQRLEEGLIFWAVEGEIYRTTLEGQNPVRTGAVALGELAVALREVTGDTTIQAGSLGGITYHFSRDKLWGVDIVNDVYFEFARDGTLSLDGDGKPIHFFSPLRNPAGGGAYGNSITYAVSGGEEYFDIPVGSLRDGKPTHVFRVHAADGADGRKIGDETGYFYELGAAIGSPKFVTGIGFWGDSCAAGQSSEFLLDLDQLGGTPRIIEVSADEPTFGSIADFQCEVSGESKVTLTWRSPESYTLLRITRVLAGTTDTPAIVYENTDPAADPGTYEEDNVPDGSWKYTAEVTAAGGTAPPQSRYITVGNGQLLAYRGFSLPDGGERSPFAITVTDDTVIVADLNARVATTYDLDLNPVGSLEGPLDSGQITGLAYGKFLNVNSELEDRLYWLHNVSGRFFLTPTNMEGQAITSPQSVFAPGNLSSGFLLADLAYDSENDFFWTIDLFNGAIYAIERDGKIASPFTSEQIESPEPNGFLSGGVAVAASSDEATTLDFPVGKSTAGMANQLARYEYAGPDFTGPGTELFRIDLQTATGAVDFAGVAISGGESESVAYVVAQDTATIYKLRITGPSTGGTTFRRGDSNSDDAVNISDPSFILEYLFRSGSTPTCLAAADADDSDSIEITDAVYLFSYLFKSGPTPPPPFARCGFDLSGELTCEEALCTN